MRIICVNTGVKFGQWYVDNLKHMIDNYSGLKYDSFEVITEEKYKGVFNKLQMFDKFRDGENLYFDLEQGVFSFEKPSKHYITGLNLDIFKRLLGIKFDHINNINISNNMRRDLIDDIITYYKYHFESFSNLKSIDVIRKTLI